MGKWKVMPKEKFKLALEFAILGNKWTENERRKLFPESTVRSFLKRAQTNQFKIKMGPAKAITDEMKQAFYFAKKKKKLSHSGSKIRSI